MNEGNGAGNASKPCYLYFLRVKEVRGEFFKIGITQDLRTRFRSIAGPFDGQVELFLWMHYYTRSAAEGMESFLHDQLSAMQAPAMVGMGNGHTEWFSLTREQLLFAISLAYIYEVCGKRINEKPIGELGELLIESAYGAIAKVQLDNPIKMDEWWVDLDGDPADLKEAENLKCA